MKHGRANLPLPVAAFLSSWAPLGPGGPYFDGAQPRWVEPVAGDEYAGTGDGA